jgi:hypothetical protein
MGLGQLKAIQQLEDSFCQSTRAAEHPKKLWPQEIKLNKTTDSCTLWRSRRISF